MLFSSAEMVQSSARPFPRKLLIALIAFIGVGVYLGTFFDSLPIQSRNGTGLTSETDRSPSRPPPDLSLQPSMVRFYRKYAPEKVRTVNKMLEKFAGQEEVMFDDCEKAHNVPGYFAAERASLLARRAGGPATLGMPTRRKYLSVGAMKKSSIGTGNSDSQGTALRAAGPEKWQDPTSAPLATREVKPDSEASLRPVLKALKANLEVLRADVEEQRRRGDQKIAAVAEKEASLRKEFEGRLAAQVNALSKLLPRRGGWTEIRELAVQAPGDSFVVNRTLIMLDSVSKLATAVAKVAACQPLPSQECDWNKCWAHSTGECLPNPFIKPLPSPSNSTPDPVCGAKKMLWFIAHVDPTKYREDLTLVAVRSARENAPNLIPTSTSA